MWDCSECSSYAVDLVVCVALGCDMFDCVFPTRTAVSTLLILSAISIIYGVHVPGCLSDYPYVVTLVSEVRISPGAMGISPVKT